MIINTQSHNNWATPKDKYDEWNKEFNFDFDPCPLNSSFDGLVIDWKKSNYVNPPYSRKLKDLFIRKAFEESKKGKLCVLLIPVATSTKVFHEVILPFAEIRFLRGRIKFIEFGERERERLVQEILCWLSLEEKFYESNV